MDTMREWSPDRRPAEGGYYVEERPSGEVLGVMKVRDHGALVLTGRDLNHGIALFTDEEILFDPS